jgi:hypothetical protein
MINHAKLKQRVWFLGDPNYLDCGETPYIASGLITDLRGGYADYEITTDDDGGLYDRDADELYYTKEALEKEVKADFSEYIEEAEEEVAECRAQLKEARQELKTRQQLFKDWQKHCKQTKEE